MDTKSSHYSLALNPRAIRAWAKREAVFLEKAINKNFPGCRPVLVYSGMSGISHASCLAYALLNLGIECKQIYVRKKNEESHGNRIETSNFNRNHKYVLVFVDDFIGGGITLNHCIGGAKKKYYDEMSKLLHGLIISIVEDFNDKFPKHGIFNNEELYVTDVWRTNEDWMGE